MWWVVWCGKVRVPAGQDTVKDWVGVFSNLSRIQPRCGVREKSAKEI